MKRKVVELNIIDRKRYMSLNKAKITHLKVQRLWEISLLGPSPISQCKSGRGPRNVQSNEEEIFIVIFLNDTRPMTSEDEILLSYLLFKGMLYDPGKKRGPPKIPHDT